jgi:hypothetical protein
MLGAAAPIIAVGRYHVDNGERADLALVVWRWEFAGGETSWDQASGPGQLGQDLLGQTVMVIGGSSGIGLETARLARARGSSTTSSRHAARSSAPRSLSGASSDRPTSRRWWSIS